MNDTYKIAIGEAAYAIELLATSTEIGNIAIAAERLESASERIRRFLNSTQPKGTET